MVAIYGNMYYYHRSHMRGCTDKACVPNCKYEKQLTAIYTAKKHFTAKYGYAPDYVVLHPNEYNAKRKYPCEARPMAGCCPRHHFILGPIVVRNARTLQVTRCAYQDP